MQKTILRSGVAAVAVAIAAFLCHALTLIPRITRRGKASPTR